jgi:hypothetical protein
MKMTSQFEEVEEALECPEECRHCGAPFLDNMTSIICPICKRSDSEPTSYEQEIMDREDTIGLLEIYRLIRAGVLP